MFAASKTASVSGGYQISRSLRFNSADSAYLNRTPASAGNLKTFTWSGWLKLSATGIQRVLSASSGSASDFIAFASDTLRFQITDSGGTPVGNLITTQVFRDYSSWYHIVIAWDTTQATSTDRIKMYVNGSQVTAFSTATYPALNTSSIAMNNTVAQYISSVGGTLRYLDGYMTETNFIDGQALTPSSFGETNAQTGVWQPKAYSGSYGTNGFYLNFSDNSNTTAATLGKDYSGNGNNWTPNNFSVTAGAGNDSLVDSPTSYGVDTGVGGTVRGNYCTWNPLDKNASVNTLNGNLDANVASGSWFSVRATFGMSSGKWYWECTPDSSSAALIGIGLPTASLATYVGGDAFGWSYFSSNGNKFNNNTSVAYGAGYTTNDVVGIAFDADNGTLTFYKNGTSQGTAYTGLTSGPYLPMVGLSGPLTLATNFGQRPFAYTAPSGFKALCTQNLPTPTIGATTATQAGKYFNTVLYTGNGSNSRSVTGVGFQPDFVWMKARSQAYANGLANAVTGVNKFLISNTTGAELTNDAYGYLSSFDSDGFSLTGGTSGNDTFNRNTDSFVAWNWKANGSGSSNTAGSITSTVSANTTSGFSVVTYTGTGNNATVGHGIGIAPSMVIVKSRSNALAWIVGHASVGFDKYLLLNATDAVATASTVWNSTNPTSTVFSIGTAGGTNTSGATYVAYCFAPVAGYSAFGSYTGNGSTDGPFVFTGFRPAWIMLKRIDATGEDWFIYDATRNTSNANNLRLEPNLSDAEVTTSNVNDFLSNGFKIRNVATSQNSSGINYIFAAFATAPFKYSLAR
jgi:hypothetical protein